MTTTKNLKLPHLATGGQQNAEPLVNESLNKLDTMAQPVVKSNTVTAEPGSPTDGDVYILASTHTGTNWAAQAEHDIAIYYGGWQFITPVEGHTAYITGVGTFQFDGSAWVTFSGAASTYPLPQSETDAILMSDLRLESVLVQAAGVPTTLVSPGDDYKAYGSDSGASVVGSAWEGNAQGGDVVYWYNSGWRYIDATTMGPVRAYKVDTSNVWELTDGPDFEWGVSSGTVHNSGVANTKLIGQTLQATAKVLTTDQVIPKAGNVIDLADDWTGVFKMLVVASKENTATAKAWEITGLIRRTGSSTGLVGSVTKTVIASDTGTTGWDVAVTADNTLEAIQVSVTGQASTVIKWVADVQFVKVN